MATNSRLNLMFFLRRQKVLKNNQYPIYVRLYYQSKSLDISIGESVDDSIWSSENGIAIGKTAEAKQINFIIDKIKKSIHRSYIQLLESEKDFSVVNIKNEWLNIPEIDNFLVVRIKEHNKEVKELVGIDYSYQTYKRYNTVLNHVEEFLKLKYKKQDIPMREVDFKFITKFENYLKLERNCNHNSTIKYIKNLKKIFNLARAYGIINTDPFVNFKMHLKKVERPFLSDNELSNLINKKFEIERIEIVKDCFLFSCFTGLAYVDLQQLTSKNIEIGVDGKAWVFTKRQKTEVGCNIPLLPVPLKIIEKYKNHPTCKKREVLLPVPSNQKMNAYLKEIADLCGIKKYLTSHIARHTFATTVTLNNDVPIETVSKMLGHSSLRVTKDYAKLLDKKVGRDMQHLHDKFAFV